jgi:ATP-dependent Lon protease
VGTLAHPGALSAIDMASNLKSEKEPKPTAAGAPATASVRDQDTDGLPEGIHTLPLLPLINTVVFPGTVMTINIGRAESIKLLEQNLPNSKRIGLVLQRSAGDELPDKDGIYRVGVAATVLKLMRPSEAAAVILVQADRRIRVVDFVRESPYLVAKVESLEDTPVDLGSDYWQANVRNLRDTAAKLIGFLEDAPDEARMVLTNIEEPGFLTDFLGAQLSIEPQQKQALIEELLVARRVEMVQQIVDNQLRITDLQQKLRADVQTEITESQKRAYLREQLRAIQKELGEEGSADEQAEDLRRRLKESGLPEAAWEQAERELKRLEILPPASPDHSVIVSYLETLAELPWNRVSEDNLDLNKAREILDHDHYGLNKVKKRLIEYLAVRKLNPDGHGPILCLLGPPGVGKTSLGQSIANALGRKLVRMSLGGIRDEAEIRGHRRTYVGAMPGRIIQEIRRAGTRNPVFMLDEIDKVGADFRGDPASALLEVLDPAQNNAFSDRYLDVDFDLSQVIFIATCNVITTVPVALRDRMEVIDIAGYTDTEKVRIAKEYLTRRQTIENGLTSDDIEWTDEALKAIIENYTREAGVRDLERRIGAVCRSIAADVASGTKDHRTIGAEDIESILGPPIFVREDKLRVSQPGVVTGLAYTPVGGEVLYIEAIQYAGHGNIVLTGQLGDVMQESARAAHSLVRSRAKQLGIDPEVFEKTDVHIHVPSGAIQKDGPSAGVAMFAALVSLYTRRAVDKDVAMTGEISLRGLVLPIGGLKEKSIAALRAGITTVIVPKLNEKDLPDLPVEVTDKIKIILVETVDAVLEHALTGKPQE